MKSCSSNCLPDWLFLFPVAGHTYETRVADSFVISSNEALLSCSLPSFASEYLSVVAWVTSEGVQIARSDTLGKGSSPHSWYFVMLSRIKRCHTRYTFRTLSLLVYTFLFLNYVFLPFLAMAQTYSVLTGDAHVMLGNDVTMGCSLPGHLTDWVTITAWRLSERGQQPLELSLTTQTHGILVWWCLCCKMPGDCWWCCTLGFIIVHSVVSVGLKMSKCWRNEKSFQDNSKLHVRNYWASQTWSLTLFTNKKYCTYVFVKIPDNTIRYTTKYSLEFSSYISLHAKH